MTDRALVDRIVAEVMRRVEAEGAAAAPAEPRRGVSCAPCGAVAPPPADPAPASAAAPAVASGPRYVVLVTCAPGGLEEAVRQVEALAGDAPVDLVVAACAADSVGPEVARRVRVRQVIREGWGPVDPAALLSSAKALVVPLPSTTVAGKAAALIHDTLAPTLVGAALLRGVPVYLSPDAMLSSLPGGGAASAAFGAVAAEHADRLARLGVRIVPLTEIARAAIGGASDTASSPTPPPRAAATAGGVCAPSATVSCGDIEQIVLEAIGNDPDGLKVAPRVSQAIDRAMQAGACRLGCTPTGDPAAHAEIARYIDHTLLKPDAKPDDVRKLCEEAKKYCFASVCINTGHVALAKRLLRGSGVKVCCVVGFPLGAMAASAKADETREAVADGADEIDTVINIGLLKAGEFDLVREDIAVVVKAARGRIVKVIFETHLLTEEEKVISCRLSKEAGAHFVKTSTGFSGGGATAEDIALMRKTVGPEMGVKASGGVRDTETAQKMIRAGANRIGTSSGIAIVTGKKAEKKGY